MKTELYLEIQIFNITGYGSRVNYTCIDQYVICVSTLFFSNSNYTFQTKLNLKLAFNEV